MSQDSRSPAPQSTVFRADMLAQSGLFKDMHKGMTITSAALVMLFVLFTGVNTDLAGTVFGSARAWIEATFGWYYLVTVVFLIAVCFFIVVSPFVFS